MNIVLAQTGKGGDGCVISQSLSPRHFTHQSITNGVTLQVSMTPHDSWTLEHLIGALHKGIVYTVSVI